jgi:hypothetical protein
VKQIMATHWANTTYTALGLTEVVSLGDGEIYRLPHGALSIRGLSGSAWITSQAEDCILETGEPLLLSRQPYTVIVSALDHQPLIFDLRKI